MLSFPHTNGDLFRTGGAALNGAVLALSIPAVNGLVIRPDAVEVLIHTESVEDADGQMVEQEVPLSDADAQRIGDTVNGFITSYATPPPDYRELRRAAYPAIGDQLDLIFHDPTLANWGAAVQAVKDKYPKPSA